MSIQQLDITIHIYFLASKLYPSTLPEINIATENWWLDWNASFLLGWPIFGGELLVLGECTTDVMTHNLSQVVNEGFANRLVSRNWEPPAWMSQKVSNRLGSVGYNPNSSPICQEVK